MSVLSMQTTHGAYYWHDATSMTPDSHAIPIEAPSTVSDGSVASWLRSAVATVQNSFLRSTDWDGRGADEPTSLAAALTISILQSIAGTHGIPQPTLISPRPDGGFVVEWGPGYFDLTVEVEPEGGPASFWYQDESGTYHEGTVAVG